jgi:uroporphyrin-III C-methyltransferase
MNQKTDDNDDSPKQAVPEAPIGDEVAAEKDHADLRPEAGSPPAGQSFEDVRREGSFGPEHPVPPAPPPRRGASSAIAWLALLLALLALAGSGYLAWQDRTTAADEAGNEAAIASLSEQLDTAVNSLGSSQQAVLAELEAASRQEATRISALEREIQELSGRSESVYPRLRNLEGAISSLQGVSAGVRETWMLAEAEYYMQIANAQLQLAGNPHIAALALEFADERVRQMANPALADVRRALTQELQALRSMETADIEGMTLALANLAERTASLPLRQDVDVPDEEADAVDPELTGFSRALASIRSAFGDIVSVRRSDEPLTPLLAPEAAYFLRANLALQLQAARLALLQGEQQVFEQSLDDAAKWLDAYYDADSGAVASALETIEQLRGAGVDVTPPDISESLRLLRQYRTLQGAESPAGEDNGTAQGGDEVGRETGADEPAQ